MFNKLVKMFVGSDEKVIAKLRPRVDEINALESEFERMEDDDLQIETQNLRRAAASGEGESLDALLPRAFAAVREAAKRALGQRHYDVQLIGGIVLHQGKIAEMKTGEGKTLVATLPAYLNSLSGRGVHVVTVNDYLARRDAHWMGAVYDALGVSVGALQNQSALVYDPYYEDGEKGFERMRPATRREAYAADITYGTNNEFGFDYLRDNMAPRLEDRVQRERAYAIVDEVDNILIDEARTPLIISGPDDTSYADYSYYASKVKKYLTPNDYTEDEKHRTVALTLDGIAKLEHEIPEIQHLYGKDEVDEDGDYRPVRHVENALKALVIFKKDRDYVVQNREVIIVDEFTGRLMTGRRYSDGLHQAIEAKEGVPVRPESITYATITLQNYFRLYEKLSGMTGTAATEAEEFDKIYKLEVVAIPTNRPMVREDLPDLIYKDQDAKYRAVVREIEERSRAGQPILVGTTDIDKSVTLSDTLRRRGIAHEVLNAKQHEREALIVSQAGKPGAVTVATNMAGRGTDIVLGGSPDIDGVSPREWEENHKRVLDAGGLHIIGTERHEARRIDNQLRGRSGRQGDPGSTQFYVALDDEIIRRFGGDRIRSVMDWAGMEEDEAISNNVVSKAVENSQVKIEAYHFDMRKHLVEYDNVVNNQRDLVYREREKMLARADSKTDVRQMVVDLINEEVQKHMDARQPYDWSVNSLVEEIARAITPRPVDLEALRVARGGASIVNVNDIRSAERTMCENLRDALVAELSAAIVQIMPQRDELGDYGSLVSLGEDKVKAQFIQCAESIYGAFEETTSPENMRDLEREIADHGWVQHLTAMENSRQGIGLQAYGQRNPLVEYQSGGRTLFKESQKATDDRVMRLAFGMALGNVKLGGRDANAVAPAPEPRMATRNMRQTSAAIAARSAGGGGRRSQRRAAPKIGRNQPCPCGSGKKYKRCCAA